MKTSIEKALEIGEQALRDTGMWDTDVENPTAKFDDGKVLFPGINLWLVNFTYGKEDYGGNGANMSVTVLDEEGVAVSISYRTGYIQLGYDKKKDKYYIKSQRP